MRQVPCPLAGLLLLLLLCCLAEALCCECCWGLQQQPHPEPLVWELEVTLEGLHDLLSVWWGAWGSQQWHLLLIQPQLLLQECCWGAHLQQQVGRRVRRCWRLPACCGRLDALSCLVLAA